MKHYLNLFCWLLSLGKYRKKSQLEESVLVSRARDRFIENNRYLKGLRGKK
jgi:hypothetical protein